MTGSRRDTTRIDPAGSERIMALSVFDDKAARPDDSMVAAALGPAKRRWDELREHISGEYAPIVQEWKFYGKQSGWTLLLKRKGRTLLYLFPCTGWYLTLFVFGAKAVQAAQQSRLPEGIVKQIEAARPHVEGRSFRVEVRTREDLGDVKSLVAIKAAN